VPNNKVNTKYNGYCSQQKPFATAGRPILLIDHAIQMKTPSRESRHEWLGSQNIPSIGSIAQHTIQKAAYGRETTAIARVEQ
jgi:hypothetical protein